MKLMVLDGNSIVNRAYYGIRPLTTRQGLYTNAIYGFITTLQRLLDEEKPEALCVTFDRREPTFRHEADAAYKAQRKGMPEELAMQMLPPDTIFSTINIGGAHNAMMTQSIIMGNHVRVGLEDVTYYAPHQLVTSNAQLVERAVRIAKELGRPVATPAQAREMLGLGAPRQY